MLANQNFNKKALALAVTGVLFNISSPALAQTENATEEDVESIQITGIRNSLIQSGAIKRESSGVVDAITAEDIGKFPDTNLAESLQRISGVSIDRSNNEGNQVTVRGFGPSFNMVTLNGRQMPRSSSFSSDGVPRSFNFRELASESVSEIQVIKTARANVDSGGIGATINIETAKPFDYGEFKAAGSVKGIIDRSVEKGDSITPEISGLISNTFLDGKFGVLFSLSHSERHSHTDRAGTEGWVRNHGNNIDTSRINNGTGTWWAAQTVDLDLVDTERERQNAQLVLQFAPTDNFVATVDYTLQRFEQTSQMNRTGMWFDSPTGQPDANGTLVNPIEVTDELNFWAWQFYEKTEGDSLGINLDWQVNDSLSFTLDVHSSESKSNPGNGNAEHRANLENGAYSLNDEGKLVSAGTKLVDITADFSGDIPSVNVDDSKLPTGDAYNPADIIPDLFHTYGYQIQNKIDQVHLAGKWENNVDSPLVEVNFGFQTTSYDMEVHRFGTFSFVKSLNIDNLGLEFESVGNALSEFGGGSSLYPLIPRYSANHFISLVQDQDLYFQAPPSQDGVEEDTVAAYVSADFQFEMGQMPVSVNVGLRYEQTDVDAFSVLESIENLQYNHVTGIQVLRDGSPVAQSLTGDYDHILPNVDVKFDITDDLVARASHGKSITRSDLNQMFPSTRIGTLRPNEEAVATQGDPGLLPYESDNFDLSFEYYYGEASFVSAGYFHKDVDNFIGEVDVTRTINDINGNPLTDPSVNADSVCPAADIPTPACFNRPDQPVIDFRFTVPTNLNSSTVDGWEFNIQHVFGDTGFGAMGNYTIVDADAEYDVRKVDGNRALTGLSDSYNLVGFYEKESVLFRLAYNWRDDFLIRGGDEPIFTEAYGQFDANASYELNDNLTVFIEGLNLTNSTVRRHGRYVEQLIDAEQYGQRYNIGIRAKF